MEQNVVNVAEQAVETAVKMSPDFIKGVALGSGIGATVTLLIQKSVKIVKNLKSKAKTKNETPEVKVVEEVE